jgi:hypothetical protein
MDRIHSLVRSIGQLRVPSTKDQWIKFLLALSSWSCHLLVAACLASTITGALALGPSGNSLLFMGADLEMAGILLLYIYNQTYGYS